MPSPPGPVRNQGRAHAAARVEPAAPKALAVSYGGVSLPGVRSTNEDAFAAAPPDRLKGAVAVIADGLSSSEQAQMASQTAVTEFIDEYLATPETWTAKTAAARVLNALNRWFCHHEGMATTVSAVIAKGRTAHVFHVGDSRVYRLRDGNLEQLTRDHRKQAMLTNALGMELHMEVDYLAEDLADGDVFLLTTDGIHDVLGAQELRRGVALATAVDASLEDVAKSVVASALEQGSDDNVSCLIARIDAAPAEDIDEAHRRLTRQVIPPPLSPGARIDGFRVLRTIDEGTRSHIYLAEDESGRRVALKVPSEAFAEDPVYLDGFIREEWIGRRIEHPGVMKVLPRPESRFLYYIAEHIDGRTLRQWMLDHPRPAIDEVRRLVGEIARALRAFQRLQMVHRDLKPDNVMVGRDGNAKIIDFGTAYAQGFDELSSAVRETHPVGSVGYVAPECLLGQGATHAADIYALGIVTYEMLTGKLPYKPPLARDAKAYLGRPYIPLAEAGRPDLPKWIDLTLAKATAQDPANRYEALSELTTDLSQPNPDLVRRAESAPLLEKNPTLFWKLVSAALAALLALTLVL
ncbi:MAG: bifunctional protein-serine/threonine kinase/phosphatase [Gammaproteobacteria bacterium]|nr:bifunctional protein-serine/threonine kinase/phosphatase [Gammaproteobacteria bacterium]